jgi:hypothetical protein
MGCGHSSLVHEDGTVLADPRYEIEGTVALVRRGDPNAFVFANAQHLAAGHRDVPLTLRSHPGKAVVPKGSRPQAFHSWNYIHLGVGDAADAVRVTQRPGEPFISLGKFCFDVAFWKYEVGNQIALVAHKCGDGRKEGGGRDFIVNADGTIGAMHASQFVLGLKPSGPHQWQRETLHHIRGMCSGWPLHYAAAIGDCDTIRRLCLREGLDPNLKMTSWYDSEPLGWAASLGQLDAVKALIEAGADPGRPPNKAGYTPITDAEREAHSDIAFYLRQYLGHPLRLNPANVAPTGVAPTGVPLPTATFESSNEFADVPAEQAFCTSCGERLGASGARFCSMCGAQVAQKQQVYPGLPAPSAPATGTLTVQGRVVASGRDVAYGR